MADSCAVLLASGLHAPSWVTSPAELAHAQVCIFCGPICYWLWYLVRIRLFCTADCTGAFRRFVRDRSPAPQAKQPGSCFRLSFE